MHICNLSHPIDRIGNFLTKSSSIWSLNWKPNSCTFHIHPFSIFFRMPSGKQTQLLKMATEIVDLPINSMVIFHSYVSLPEGNASPFFPKPSLSRLQAHLRAVAQRLEALTPAGRAAFSWFFVGYFHDCLQEIWWELMGFNRSYILGFNGGLMEPNGITRFFLNGIFMMVFMESESDVHGDFMGKPTVLWRSHGLLWLTVKYLGLFEFGCDWNWVYPAERQSSF